MKLTILESPYAAATQEILDIHIWYARSAMKQLLLEGYAPFASHLLYTQPGILDDNIQQERNQGILAGMLWSQHCSQVHMFIDLGISPGMASARRQHNDLGRVVINRRLTHYRGWLIDNVPNPIGEYTATSPDYDASYEGPEDGWVESGGKHTASSFYELFTLINDEIDGEEE